jgi:hypothetical protein
MARRYDHTLYLTIGSNEIALDVVYKVTPGCPETGPSYACGGTPASPAEVDILTVEAVLEEWRFGKKIVKREPVTGWLLSLIANDPDINADLLSDAGADDESAAAEAAASRADDLRDMRRSA